MIEILSGIIFWLLVLAIFLLAGLAIFLFLVIVKTFMEIDKDDNEDYEKRLRLGVKFKQNDSRRI